MDIVWNIVMDILTAILITFVVVYGAALVTVAAVWMRGRYQAHQTRKRARIEAELDRKQEELRRQILLLAQSLGMEAHEARRAMIRESFIASGHLPDQRR